jgi:predicted ATP-dependent protease
VAQVNSNATISTFSGGSLGVAAALSLVSLALGQQLEAIEAQEDVPVRGQSRGVVAVSGALDLTGTVHRVYGLAAKIQVHAGRGKDPASQSKLIAPLAIVVCAGVL